MLILKSNPSSLEMQVFVVYNPNSKFGRYQNMERRLKQIGLWERTIMVRGGDPHSDLIRYYAADSGEGLGGDPRVVACLIGHLSVIRAFVGTGAPRGCILEDDVLFRDDFAERLDQLPEANIVQLYSMSGYEHTKTGPDIYGAQGYVISRDYAQRCLQRYDRPLRYWDDGLFRTAEAILMYSDGIVLGSEPLVVEDGLSYSISDQMSPNEFQLKYQTYAYSFGLDRYLSCDPEFHLPAAVIVRIFNTLTSRPVTGIMKVLRRTYDPQTAEEELVMAILYMLSGYYIDRPLAQQWADRLFRLVSRGDLSSKIQQYRTMLEEVCRFYHPSYPERVWVPQREKVQWSDTQNWVLLPNAPCYQE